MKEKNIQICDKKNIFTSINNCLVVPFKPFVGNKSNNLNKEKQI